MTKEDWKYGMLEMEFAQSELPSYDEYMNNIEEKLTVMGVVEPLFSGKIAGANEYWTFVRHRIEPREIYELCKKKLTHVKNYSHCYSFKRFRGELITKIMREKHKYIGLARLPEMEEYNESELEELTRKLEEFTPFHVAWISKSHREDGMNTYFFLTGNVEPEDIEKHRKAIDEHIDATSSRIHHIQKFAHHKSHRKSAMDKEKSIREFMPEDFIDNEWLREYDYFHWSK